MSIRNKILLATLPLFILFGVISMVLNIRSLDKQGERSINTIQDVMTNDRNEKLQDLVRNSYEIIASSYKAANDPEMVAKEYERELNSIVNLAFSTVEKIGQRTDIGEEEKKRLAAEAVGMMRYGGDNYLWINDMVPKMVMHPIKPALNGQDLSDFADPNGKKLFSEMARVCRESGEGYVDYFWPKPGAEKPVAKLSYVKLFRPWNWIIGTGVYLEAAESDFQEATKKEIGNMRFGPDLQDYFFIINSKAEVVMHPIKPELNGQSMADFEDPNGKRLFAEMANVARSEGEGFVDYFWPKPGEDKPVEKLSYVKFFPEWDWVVATGIYVDDIKKAMDKEKEGVASAISKQRWSTITFSLVMIVIAAVIITLLAQRVSAPIRNASEMLKDIAQGEGDLTKRLVVKTKDELAEMAKWFNIFVENLQKMIKGMAVDADEIQKSAVDLSGISTIMSDSSGQTSEKANSVAAAMEEMSANMSNVATAMSQTANSVDVVAAAVEEMTATINEIAQTSEKARSITEKAVEQTAESSERVDELGKSAEEINKVLETIADISDQVDLLALNATIEAARAGDAGKGFAVVASEIKELAKQTAEATDEIKARIEGIQKTTSATVSQISTISSVVSENSEIVNTIATAVEEQSVTATEISQSVAQISQGIQEINHNVSQSSEVSQDVSREIAVVNQQSSEMSTNSQQVSSNAGRLSSLADGLAKLVGKFKV